MKSTLIVAVVGLVVIVGGLVYFLLNQTPAPVSQYINSSGDLVISTEEPMVISTPEASELLAGGSSYSDPQGIYTFLYPNDYTLDTENETAAEPLVRIFKRGDSQRPQSEMSDGVLLVFQPINLGTQTLEEWVDANIQTMTANGMSELTQPKQAVLLNSYPGFTYSTRGLGEASYTVVQKSPSSSVAVVITNAVMDPQQRGYAQELGQILSTFSLLK